MAAPASPVTDPAPPPRSSAPDLLRRRAEAHPDSVALNVDDTGSLTYRAWDRRSEAVARTLLDRGVRPGDRIVLLFGGLAWVDYAIAYIGVLKAGGTAVHVAGREPAAELWRRIGHTGPVGIVHGAGVAPPGGFAGWTATVAALDRGAPDQPVAVPVDPDAIADILYTSGTTGPAKPFTVPHGNLSFSLARAARATFDDSAPMLTPMPLGTTSSANIAGNIALGASGTVIVCQPDDAERVAALIERHRVGTVMLPPWVAIQLVASRAGHRYDLSCVTSIGTAAAPMPSAVARGLLAMMPGAGINTAYAQSEAMPAVIINTYDPERPTCLGRPGPGTELRVAGPDGEPVAAGEVGEVWLRCAAPKRLYLDESLNAQVHAGGWTRTRDLGYLGDDGRLYLFDRGTDVIRTRQGPVSSVEVEDVLYTHPGVLEAAVFGVPGPSGGQAVVAAVARRCPAAGPDGDGSGPAAEAEDFAAGLVAYAADRLAGHQVPVSVRVVPSLPRGVTGKVRKYLLRERWDR